MPINSLIQLRDLLIWILERFSTNLIPLNLFIFKDTKNEDLFVYIKYFIETLTTYLIINGCYHLINFSTILKERTYEWY